MTTPELAAAAKQVIDQLAETPQAESESGATVALWAELEELLQAMRLRQLGFEVTRSES